jgi:hypothetical protein
VLIEERVDHLLAVFATRSYRFHTEEPLSRETLARLHFSFPEAEVRGGESNASVDITFDHALKLYEALQILRDGNVTLRSIEHRTPDLEEIFLCLLREALT